jgi:hypothetical protein
MAAWRGGRSSTHTATQVLLGAYTQGYLPTQITCVASSVLQELQMALIFN